RNPHGRDDPERTPMDAAKVYRSGGVAASGAALFSGRGAWPRHAKQSGEEGPDARRRPTAVSLRARALPAPRSGGARRGPSGPPSMKRCRWALIAALLADAQEDVEAAPHRDGEVEQAVAVQVGRHQVRAQRALEVDGPSLGEALAPHFERDQDLARLARQHDLGPPIAVEIGDERLLLVA